MPIDFVLCISSLPNILQNYCQVSLNENDCAIEQSEANIGLSPVQLKELVVGSNVQLKLPFQLI